MLLVVGVMRYVVFLLQIEPESIVILCHLSIIVIYFCFFEQTGVALGVEVDDQMPRHEYIEYYGPDYNLHVAPSNTENKNCRDMLEEIRAELLMNLSRLQHAPSVQFQERPPNTELPEVCSFYR